VTTCPRPEALDLYLEGELGPYDARKLEEHLEDCPACREALEERRALLEAFASLPPFEVPEGFAKSVMAALPEPEAPKAVWLGPLLAGTAALAIGLFGYYLFTGTSIPEVLVAINGFFGSALARLAPLAFGFDGLATFSRVLGRNGIILILGLGLLLSALAVCGARRFLHQGERS
jgi:anti-sigma factor RsiW